MFKNRIIFITAIKGKGSNISLIKFSDKSLRNAYIPIYMSKGHRYTLHQRWN